MCFFFREVAEVVQERVLTSLLCRQTSVVCCLSQGSSLSSVGYLSGSSWIVMLPSKMEFAKFIMKVTLQRPVDELVDDVVDDHSDIQVVEFWKRMGFEDIAEAGTEIDKTMYPSCQVSFKTRLHQQHWDILRHIETYWDILRHIETYWDILRHIETYWDYVRQFNPIKNAWI